jgi:hypothetical protein
MPIHINLLAEAQAAEEMRRHDPVKRATFIGASLVVLALLWSGIVEINVVLARESLEATQTEIASKTNVFQQVQMAERQAGQDRFRLTALQKLQAARFLQGNLLNALQQATVDGVQLTRLRLDQSYSVMAVSGAKTNNEHIREKIVLHLNAKDSSANPGDQVNKFQTTIAKQPYFEAMLSKTNAVQLAGSPSALQTDASNPYVTFMLDCYFPDQIR